MDADLRRLLRARARRGDPLTVTVVLEHDGPEGMISLYEEPGLLRTRVFLDPSEALEYVRTSIVRELEESAYDIDPQGGAQGRGGDHEKAISDGLWDLANHVQHFSVAATATELVNETNLLSEEDDLEWQVMHLRVDVVEFQ